MENNAVAQAARAQADAFADEVGLDRQALKLANMEQAQRMLKECVAIAIQVKRWRAATTVTMTDIGVTADDADEARALAGLIGRTPRYLLPKRIIDQGQKIENSYRNLMIDCKTANTVWGPVLSLKKFLVWREKSAEIEAEYKSFVMDVYDHWDELRAETHTEYVHLGWNVYTRLVAAGKLPAMSGSDWVEAFAQRMMTKVITADQWLAKAEIKQMPPVYIRFEPPAPQDVYEAELARARNDMERAVLEGARENYEKNVLGFIAQVRGEFTEKVIDVVSDVQAGLLKNGGKLHRNSSKQLRNLVDAVETLKFWDDPKLDASMAKISSMLEERATQRDYKELDSVLRQIGFEARLVLNELSDVAEADVIGVETEPEFEMVEPVETEIFGIEINDEFEDEAFVDVAEIEIAEPVA